MFKEPSLVGSVTLSFYLSAPDIHLCYFLPKTTILLVKRSVSLKALIRFRPDLFEFDELIFGDYSGSFPSSDGSVATAGPVPAQQILAD